VQQDTSSTQTPKGQPSEPSRSSCYGGSADCTAANTTEWSLPTASVMTSVITSVWAVVHPIHPSCTS